MKTRTKIFVVTIGYKESKSKELLPTYYIEKYLVRAVSGRTATVVTKKQLLIKSKIKKIDCDILKVEEIEEL
jgi:hypothetical protein